MVSPRVRAIVALVAGTAFVAGLVAIVGPHRVFDAILQASLPHLLLAAGAYAAFFAIRGARWRTLLSRPEREVRFSSTTSATAVGWLANSFLPLKGGDVLRAAVVAKREGIDAGEAAASVALERVLDLVGLAIVAAVGILLIPHGATPAWMDRALGVAWLLPTLAILGLAIMIALRGPSMRLAHRALSPMGRMGAGLLRFLEAALQGVATLAQRPRILLSLVPQTIIVAIAQALIFTFLAMAFIPTMSFWIGFCGSSIFLLSFIVSVTPGNIGTYEAAFAAVFAALGAPIAITLPAAVLTHLTTTVMVAIMGSVGALILSMTSTKTSPSPPRIPTGGGHP